MQASIYLIHCSSNNRVYVGKTDNPDPQRRWTQHQQGLRYHTHHNAPLQQAWNQYGEQAFSFEVIDQCKYDEAPAVEQLWLERFSNNIGQLFNRLITGGSINRLTPAGRRRVRAAAAKRPMTPTAKRYLQDTWETKATPVVVQSPDGQLFTVTLCREFARKHGLPKNLFLRMCSGKAKSCRGWKRCDDPNSLPKQNALVSPTGEVFANIDNRSQFCRDHQLPYSSISKLMAGEIESVHGWTRPDSQLRSWTAISPDGQRHHVTQLKQFCTTHGLAYQNVQAVIGGHVRTHRQWRFRRAT